ncbi:MAG: primosomal protein N' [Eubacteriales bacterium]|nr:primosomal protein N' [Eubacteriales bacterium]
MQKLFTGEERGGGAQYAKIIVDCSAEAVDRAFTYRIPETLKGEIVPGVRVNIPFGNAKKPRTGYVTELLCEADYDAAKIRDILSLSKGATRAEGDMITLAGFLAEEYGSTMNQALKTVLPVRHTVRKNSRRTDPVAVMEELFETENAVDGCAAGKPPQLNEEQAAVLHDMKTRYEAFYAGKKEGAAQTALHPSLLFGITGSGKTLVYIRLIEYMQQKGLKSIVLIPEISLTYQTVRELSRYFGDRVSVLHSRLSSGERYEQYEKARKGQIDVMVGPRSALFAPFEDLGLIIIDEEHERAYHSDTSPRYDAREAAMLRARLAGAMLLLGSATPSMLSYSRALSGTYRLYRLKNRAVQGAMLPKIHVSDMREELMAGNRSLFSGKLRALMEDRLMHHRQIMLFINRRGYAGFVSCRSCGFVVKCPHCDVSLTAHNNWYYDRQTGKREAALLSCHYCGYKAPMPARCPECGSSYIAPFGTGTQKVETEIKKLFPSARTLRMDADTTAAKGAHERILNAFRKQEADILLGTQMIVKGHDFPNVTLVGVLAADLSLYASEYDASERTFQLLMQASGRAGRGTEPGDVVIQSYDPSHYAVAAAAVQDYDAFYEREMSFRRLLSYPPVVAMLGVRFQSADEALLSAAAADASEAVKPYADETGAVLIGPCNAGLYKVNDIYRKILYIKHGSHDIIIKIRERIRAYIQQSPYAREVYLSYDLEL